MVSPQPDHTGSRFFDTRAAYMMFVTTTNEKAVVADRLGRELAHVRPSQPGIRVFDAGMGDATVLSHLMREMHEEFPHHPWLVVGKEISLEDVRQALSRMPDRFIEHPELVLVVTNLHFREAPQLDSTRSAVTWREIELEGSTSHEFTHQIERLVPTLADDWAVVTSPVTGNPVYRRPTVLVIYRRDRRFPLEGIIPRPGGATGGYDLVIASQAYRAAAPVDRKVRTVIAPLARALAPSGRLVVVQARGHDPGLDIVREVWPDIDPFPDDRHVIAAAAAAALSDRPDLVVEELTDEESFFRYHLHAMPSESTEHIGTSTVLAAWNAAAYVAQIDDRRMEEAVSSGAYVEATRRVMERRDSIWFEDESFLIRRRAHH